MPSDWGFIGGTYRGYSPQSQPARSVNLFTQTITVPGMKSRKRFVRVPGKRRFGTVPFPDAPGRGLFHQDGEVYAVAGSSVFKLHANGSYTAIGSVRLDGDPVIITGNGYRGNQRLFLSGGRGYIWNTSTSSLDEISDPQFPTGSVISGGYLDGYFVVITRERFHISDLLDGTVWGADVGQRVGAPENLMGAILDHELLWLAGRAQTEVWSDTGAASFPLEPVPGVFIEHGLEATHAICRLGDSVAWLSSDERGGRQVMRNQGYNAVPISHEGISAYLETLPSVTDARMWSMTMHGHLWAVLSIPSQRVTLVYDAKENDWFEMLFWNTTTGLFESDRSACHCYAYGKHLTLDRETGDIWEITPEAHYDGLDALGNQRPLAWMRIAQGPYDEGRLITYPRAELIGGMGVGLAASTAQGHTPTVELDYSDDAGKTFDGRQTASLGKLGIYDNRAQFWMLGASRNRVWRLRGSDPVETVFDDLVLDVQQGAH